MSSVTGAVAMLSLPSPRFISLAMSKLGDVAPVCPAPAALSPATAPTINPPTSPTTAAPPAHVAQRQQHPQRVVPHVVVAAGCFGSTPRRRRAASVSSPAPHQMLPQLLLDVLFLRAAVFWRTWRSTRRASTAIGLRRLALEPGDVVLVHSLRAVVAHVVDVGVVAVVVDGVDVVVTRGPLGRIGLRGVRMPSWSTPYVDPNGAPMRGLADVRADDCGPVR